MKKAPTTFQASGACGEQLTFLPPPEFCPQWPTKGTLPDKALRMFLAGQVFDHPEFECRTESWRLGAVVFTLREFGWPIKTLEVSSPTADCPDRIIARYHLPGEYAAKAMTATGRTANV